MDKIVVVGSTNVDKILQVPRYTKSGETLSTPQAQITKGGGKGANQAIAAARFGANTTFISKIGFKGQADFILDTLEKDHIDISQVRVSKHSETGQAYITVDSNGRNSLYVYGGANLRLRPQEIVQSISYIKTAEGLISQLEVPIKTVLVAFEIAKKHHLITILNPAPAPRNSDKSLTALYQLTDVITPNETETMQLTGIPINNEKQMWENAQYFFNQGVKVVVITLGERGVFYATADEFGIIPAQKVNKIVDTTAAGDTFIGVLATKLKHDLSNVSEALKYATKASAITIQKAGAQSSIPYKKALEN